MVQSNEEGLFEAGQVVELVGGIYGGGEERAMGEVQVSHAKRTRCRCVIKERGRRKMRCSFLNNVSLVLCDEEFDSTMDESDEEIELEEKDGGEERGAVEVVQRVGAGVMEDMEADEVGQGGGVSRVVEGVKSVGGRKLEDVGMRVSERGYGSRVSERHARAVKMRGRKLVWTGRYYIRSPLLSMEGMSYVIQLAV